MLNKTMIIGRLGSDPDARFTQDGTCVCNLSIATTEKFKNRNGEKQEKTEWHRVVLWGRLGEVAREYLHKGSLVYIEGKIETRKWQDKDGNDRYTTEIRALNMQMLGGRGGEGGERPPAPQGQKQAGDDPFADAPDADADLDSEIPF